MGKHRVVAVTGAAAAAVMWRSFRRVEVVGGSMSPALLPGDRLVVVARPWRPPRWPRPGEVIAVRDPREPSRVLVKRVVGVDRPKGMLEVAGDAPDASTDSRRFGPVPRASVVGRAVYRYAPAARSGPGPWPGSTIGPDAKPSG
ncbi:MAG: nickel-type superoxide dismutase maturation protease [Acidimicrobiales bacterium]